KITLEGAKKSRRVFPGDLILTNSMSYGRPYIVKIEGCIHDGWFVLRSKQSIYTDYLYYILLSPLTQKQFGNLAYGSVVQNVNGDLVKSVSFPLPPLQEQQEIVDFLTTLDQKLDIHRRKRACLENIFRLFLPNLTRGTLCLTEFPEGCF
ncbi:MAG: restriction endonuclease subunit S, partial [Acetobacter sp.]|nr:restriction endonuclease subunit S [Acetobacter sp.]